MEAPQLGASGRASAEAGASVVAAGCEAACASLRWDEHVSNKNAQRPGALDQLDPKCKKTKNKLHTHTRR
jgi:hypothetical protein